MIMRHKQVASKGDNNCSSSQASGIVVHKWSMLHDVYFLNQSSCVCTRMCNAMSSLALQNTVWCTLTNLQLQVHVKYY